MDNTENEALVKASFNDIRNLYLSESNFLLKKGYGLTLKALSPGSFERQNVNLVLKVFNEYIISALRTSGKDGTSYFLEYIWNWWCIVNVKTPNKGFRLNNPKAFPLSTNTHGKGNLEYLKTFLSWLDIWHERKDTKGLSKDTFTAISHTTHCLVELTNYCLEELNFEYILPGKLQTDNLEARFGRYRRLAGCNHNISVSQLYECENKIRLESCLKLSVMFNDTDIIEHERCMYKECADIDIVISEADLNDTTKHLPTITYLGGYCCYTVLKKLSCQICRNNLVDPNKKVLPHVNQYMSQIDRGICCIQNIKSSFF